MITVEYPPGGSDPIHRHNAAVFVYVLEGSVVMQLGGGEETTLTPGQTFYEGPMMFTSFRGMQAQPNRRNSLCSSWKILVRQIAACQHQRWPGCFNVPRAMNGSIDG
jgi:glyoxylate utilization-related uncharacterized protein